MTREQLRLLLIKHHSRRHVARALGWSEWETRRVFKIHEMRDWKDELTDAEIRTAWVQAHRCIGEMATNMHISSKTARKLLMRIGMTPSGRGKWKRGRKPQLASLHTGQMATWPALDEWQSPFVCGDE